MKKLIPLFVLAVLGVGVISVGYLLSNQSAAPESSHASISSTYSEPLSLPFGAVLKDKGGNPVALNSLAFVITGDFDGTGWTNGGKGEIWGMDKNSNHFTIWQKTGPSTFNYKSEGYLQNSAGVNVTSAYFKFVIAANVDGDNLDDIVGLYAGQSYISAWSFNSPSNITASNTLKPKYESYLRDSLNGLVQVDNIKFLVAGDFNGDYKTDIRAFMAGSSTNYIWTISPTNQYIFPLVEEVKLQNDQGADVSSDTLTYVTVSKDDPNNSNIPGNSIVIATQDSWYYAWGMNSKPLWDYALCNAPGACVGKNLVFSLDQGYSNGLIDNAPSANTNSTNTNYSAALDRIIATLKSFKTKYTVYALINPMIMDRSKLDFVLSKLNQNNINFIFDNYSSDSIQIGSRTAANVPNDQRVLSNKLYDVAHGLTMSTTDLQTYKNNYPNTFAGIRIFEIMGSDYIFQKCYTDSSFCNYDTVLPGKTNIPRFYDRSLSEPLFAFAKQNGMFILWGDAQWFNKYNYFYDDPIPNRFNQIVQDINDLSQKYPGVLYGMYDNNEGTSTVYQRDYRIKNWQTKVNSITSEKGFAISDQSWMCDNEILNDDMNCPVQDFSIWAADAYRKSAQFVQVEPFEYLFNWPRGEIGFVPNVYDPVTGKGTQSNIDWTTAGTPKDRMYYFAQEMGVTL